jgi:hypothetical protein
MGRAYGIGIGVSYGVLALIGSPSATTGSKLWEHAVATASWVAGIGALSLARDLSERDAVQGVSSIARLRGFSEHELERARTFAGAERLASTVLAPGLIVALALLVKYQTLRGALTALALAVLTLPYAALVGGVLAPLARACSHWLPQRGRWLFSALTLGPWLLGLGLQQALPSLPLAFSWLLDNLSRSVR